MAQISDDTVTPNGIWEPFMPCSDAIYIMKRNKSAYVTYSPLYLFSFAIRDKLPKERKDYISRFESSAYKKSTAAKLKYYRYKNALRQKDVADHAGIDRSTYIHYENMNIDYIPQDKLERIAEMYQVDISELLDEYNAFLFAGQGRQIRAYRLQLNMTQREFAEHFCVSVTTVKRWEKDVDRITKASWNRIFNRTHLS